MALQWSKCGSCSAGFVQLRLAGAGLEIAPDNFDLISVRLSSRLSRRHGRDRAALRSVLRQVTPMSCFAT